MARAATPAPEAEPQDQAASDVQKRRAAYAAAEVRLREKYADEFKAMVNEEAATRGVTYVFRKTEAERAAEQLDKLLADHPELRERLAPQPLPPQ